MSATLSASKFRALVRVMASISAALPPGGMLKEAFDAMHAAMAQLPENDPAHTDPVPFYPIAYILICTTEEKLPRKFYPTLSKTIAETMRRVANLLDHLDEQDCLFAKIIKDV